MHRWTRESSFLLPVQYVPPLLSDYVSHTSFRQIVYYIYKKYEPSGPVPTALLLVALPGLLASALQAHFTNLLWALASVSFSYWTLLALFVIAYRLSPFHPLSAYPGPILYKISKIWHAFFVARDGKSHLYIQELHQRYGEVVRIGQTFLRQLDHEASHSTTI